MSLFEAVLSGIVQGITEFLPVSSSGHLVVLHRLVGLEQNQIAFDIFLHIGTLLAIFIVFWRDLIDIFTIKKEMLLYIIMGSIVTAVFVLIFGKKIEGLFTNIKAVGAMFILTGLWLILGNFLRFTTSGVTVFKSCVIGFAQGIASIPGISRSGATISTALFLGFDGQRAARFSFLLAIPAITGAFLFKLKELSFSGFSSVTYFAGLFTSCIVGVISLRLLLRTIYRKTFHLFGVYCIVLGAIVLVML